MQMIYNGVLKMPQNYAVMNETEMMYTEGGVLRVGMRPFFVNKDKCQEYAAGYLRIGIVTGMTQLEIAQEIYAHARVYYWIDAINDLGIHISILDDIKAHANPIDIENGGDSRKGFKEAFALIWKCIPSKSV